MECPYGEECRSTGKAGGVGRVACKHTRAARKQRHLGPPVATRALLHGDRDDAAAGPDVKQKEAKKQKVSIPTRQVIWPANPDTIFVCLGPWMFTVQADHTKSVAVLGKTISATIRRMMENGDVRGVSPLVTTLIFGGKNILAPIKRTKNLSELGMAPHSVVKIPFPTYHSC